MHAGGSFRYLYIPPSLILSSSGLPLELAVLSGGADGLEGTARGKG